MKYSEKLKLGFDGCPFCNLKREEILKSNRFANLIVARAPYSKDHLLVVSKRHVFYLNELKKEELDSIGKLVLYGMKKLHNEYKNVSIVYREGEKEKIGKSIDHLHVHLIPKLKIGAGNIKDREFFSEKKYLREIERVKGLFLRRFIN